MKTRTSNFITAVSHVLWVCGIGLTAQAFAADAAADAAAHCRTLSDGVARLSCYDRAFGVVVPAGTAAMAAPAADKPVIAADTEAGFGLTAEQREQRSQGRSESRRELTEVSATVSDIKQLRGGRFTLTLDNGQVWQQRETDASMFIEVGDTVTIKKAVLGSYLLVTEGRRSTKVARVR